MSREHDPEQIANEIIDNHYELTMEGHHWQFNHGERSSDWWMDAIFTYYNNDIAQPDLDGTYFVKEIARHINRFLRDFDKDAMFRIRIH